MPNFHDLPDGSSSINHTSFDEFGWCHIEDTPAPPPPHPSYADGSAPLMPPTPNLTDIYNAEAFSAPPRRPVARRRIEARMFSQGTAPFPANAGETVRRPQTATEVNEARRRENPEWRPIPAHPPYTNPVGYSRDFLPPCSPATEEIREALSAPPRRPNRRGEVVKKDPNAWSMREAVELCKLLEVVIPEAGFHIALTGGLLHKEGRQANCDLLFYQIRGVQPNYEILWKYLTVAGVIRLPEDSYNGFVVRATYRGKAVDCLFPNAKKVGAAKGDCYKAAPVLWDAAQTASTPAPIIYHRIPDDLEEFLASNDPAPVAPASRRESERIAAAIAADLGIASGIPAVERVTEARRPIIPILYRRTPSAPPPYDPAELLATPAPAPVPPPPTINSAVAASRIVESAASAFTSPVPSDPRPTGRANSFGELRAEVAAHLVSLRRTSEAPIPPPPPAISEEPPF